MSEEKNEIEMMKEQLFYKSRHAETVIEDEKLAVQDFADGYMDFMNEAKIEREAV